MNVSFHELAERELNEAAEYFNQRQPGLGAALIADPSSAPAGSSNTREPSR